MNKKFLLKTNSRAEAEQALAASGHESFLVRVSKGALVLSTTQDGVSYHIKITHSPSGYRLQGMSREDFGELEGLVDCYRSNPITDNPRITLGKACKKIKEADIAGKYLPEGIKSF